MSTLEWFIVAAVAITLGVAGIVAVRRAQRRTERAGYGDVPLIQAPRFIPLVNEQWGGSTSGLAAADYQVYDGATVRFHRPLAATVKLLPGRLEVIEGEERNEEIRFARLKAGLTEVTLGRGPGEPLRHIQFKASTVSRDHARMVYADSRWLIINHSRTNPVLVNGVELAAHGAHRRLHDGDLIELGAVVFRFHEQ